MTSPVANPNAQPGQWEWHVFQTMTYNVLAPDSYDPNASYPLILFLHQLENESGEPQQTDPWFNTADFRRKHPCFVLVPHCNINGQTSGGALNWGGVSPDLQQPITYALTVMQQIIATHNIDQSRILITGNSMGGLGTWGVLCNPDQRKLFAAAIPVSGSCYYNVGNEAAIAQQLKNYPIWSCHGGQDNQVSPQFDQTIMPMLMKINPLAKFTNDPNGQHDTWDGFYPMASVWEWVFNIAFGGSPVVTKPPRPESANNTIITAPSAAPIITKANEAWSLTNSKQVAVENIVDPVTSSVVKLVYHNGQIFQQNTAGGWWSKTLSTDGWTSTTSPIVVPPPPPPPPTVTHTTVQAQIDALTSALVKLRNDVGTLTP